MTYTAPAHKCTGTVLTGRPRQGGALGAERFAAAGLCHSDDHLRTGDIPVRYPIVGGHEGVWVIEGAGAGVSRLTPGDYVVCSFRPARWHVPVPRRRRGFRPDVPDPAADWSDASY